jgi:GWxTD domain-containing protein
MMVSLILVTTILEQSAGSARAQENPELPVQEVARFYVDMLSYASDSSGKSRVDLYLEVPHRTLQFVKEGIVFHASYEVFVTILDSADRQISESFWREEIDTDNFEETVSLQSGKLSQRVFFLPPARYTILTQVRDTETKKSGLVKRVVVVRDFSSSALSMSDPMFIRNLSYENGKTVLVPNITSNIGEAKTGFYIFFETYNAGPADSVSFMLNIRNIKGEIIQNDSLKMFVPAGKKSFFPNINSGRLGAGDYTLELALLSSAPQEVKKIVAKPFMVRWQGLPVSIENLDLAIDQLQYVADEDQIDAMKKLPSDEKRIQFQDFWKKKDPSPNTERNELMEEYYGRIEYANKNFGHYTEGWKTDRGMVYIIFGAPNNIERHPFDIDAKPYEIWTYYQLDREFVFVDMSGFGDYRLQTPMWDIWRTRPR